MYKLASLSNHVVMRTRIIENNFPETLSNFCKVTLHITHSRLSEIWLFTTNFIIYKLWKVRRNFPFCLPRRPWWIIEYLKLISTANFRKVFIIILCVSSDETTVNFTYTTCKSFHRGLLQPLAQLNSARLT